MTEQFAAKFFSVIYEKLIRLEFYGFIDDPCVKCRERDVEWDPHLHLYPHPSVDHCIKWKCMKRDRECPEIPQDVILNENTGL